MNKTLKKFFKWYKLPQEKDTMIEVTKDYFSEDDEYINPENGWHMLPKEFIELKLEERKRNGDK